LALLPLNSPPLPVVSQVWDVFFVFGGLYPPETLLQPHLFCLSMFIIIIIIIIIIITSPTLNLSHLPLNSPRLPLVSQVWDVHSVLCGVHTPEALLLRHHQPFLRDLFAALRIRGESPNKRK
jgi:hypothetical protein